MLRSLAVVAVIAVVASAAALKVDTIGALTESSVAEPVRSALDAKGLKVIGETGKAICEVWFRKEVPTAKREVPGAMFAQIPEGTLVGVIHFAEAAQDFRGQKIKEGFYTMRYALILEDGNHQGVSATKDFVLLCPVSQDKDPTVTMTPEQTIKLSRTAAGSAHPSPWSMVPVSDSKTLPKAIKNEQEHVILEVNVNTKSGPMAIGLIVVGKTEG
jgi:hypothetical protein